MLDGVMEVLKQNGYTDLNNVFLRRELYYLGGLQAMVRKIMKEQRTEFKKYHRLIEKHWKKVLAIILPILCLGISDMGVYSATDFEDKQMILDIENDNSYDVCMDAVYGEWEITEYIGSAMANPGISSVIPKEHGRTKEIGTVICIEEDYFKYGDNEKEDSIYFAMFYLYPIHRKKSAFYHVESA